MSERIKEESRLGDPRLPQGFWDRVERPIGTGCWLWTGSRSAGYGQFWNGGPGRAHRASYEALVGEIPEGYQCDHLCRVPRCCNPDHLEAVSNRTNVLRGIGPTAANARKTHCPHGHEYTEANTKISRGRRYCRICRRARSRDWGRRNQARKNELKREARARKKAAAGLPPSKEGRGDD